MLRALITILFISCISVAQAQTNSECLVSAIFYEANTEPLEGKVAVKEVIENRAKVYGKSICQVVRQKGQFSWYGKKPIRKLNKEMKELLTIIKNQPRILRDEMYFFRKEIRPKWARKMQCQRVGNHKFCRLKLGERNVRTKVQSR